MSDTRIDKPSDHFNVLEYNGNGGAQAISNVLSFRPAWLWIKKTNATKYHNSYDSSRGPAKLLKPNTSLPEENKSTGVTSFDSSGFSLGSSSGVNASGGKYAAWCWRANAGTETANVDGTIGPAPFVQTDGLAGFSIIEYTGDEFGGDVTIGHGLEHEPKFVIIKTREAHDGDQSWFVYHHFLANNKHLHLDLNVSQQTNSDIFQGNNEDFKDSTFTVGGDSDVNRQNVDYIAYAFTDVLGYSKFDSYSGNSSTNGPFVYTGFQPAWLMIKRVASNGDWLIFDSKMRDAETSGSSTTNSTNNPRDTYLAANFEDPTNGFASTRVDFYSNGFKFTGGDSNLNSNSGFIYAAFAAHPIVTSGGVPNTAE